MTINKNAFVRVKPELLDGLVKSVRLRVEGRIGRCDGSFVPLGRGTESPTVRVFWMNRRNGNENAVADFWLEKQLEVVVGGASKP